jgi:hypothetical protein
MHITTESVGRRPDELRPTRLDSVDSGTLDDSAVEWRHRNGRSLNGAKNASWFTYSRAYTTP